MRKIYFTLLLFACSHLLLSQIGINTTTPDPSSVLDVSSTSGGMLAPRMTSAQRLAITSAATSLLVFDTDVNAFYYFDGTTWVQLGTARKRDNYKLVKSIADLADESTGSEYLLQTDYLYEINGTILVDLPINMNGAYIEGVDSGEDVLLNASGGPLFQGTGSGSIRNLTLFGNGSPIFNLTGTGSELLVVNNTIVANASAVGTISSMSTVFFNIVQYVGNSNGFTVSNIGSFLMNNMFWTTTNTGTFIAASGSFDNFQMGNGRIEADTGEIGLDVSANPTIVNEAALSEISFIGAGTRVEGYTIGSYSGYNFNIDWNVSSSGIPTETDEVASANFYSTTYALTSTGFAQAISNNTAIEIQGDGTFASSDLFRFRVEGGGNRVIYEGESDRNVQVNVSLSIRVTGATGDFYSFVVAQNGVVVTETNAIVRITNDADIQNVALNGILSLENDDYIEVFVQRLTGTGNDNLIIFSENLSVR